MMGEAVNGFSCRRRRKHGDDFNNMFSEPVCKSVRPSGHQEESNGNLLHSSDSAFQLETRSPVCQDVEMDTACSLENQTKLPVNSFPLSGLNSWLEAKQPVIANEDACHFSASAIQTTELETPVPASSGSVNGLVQQGLSMNNNGHSSNGLIQMGCLAPSDGSLTECQSASDQVTALPGVQQVPHKSVCLQCAAGESGHFHHIQRI